MWPNVRSRLKNRTPARPRAPLDTLRTECATLRATRDRLDQAHPALLGQGKTKTVKLLSKTIIALDTAIHDLDETIEFAARNND